jgi:NTP pyrophosphatase (non-canonical NTP hydrolase)
MGGDGDVPLTFRWLQRMQYRWAVANFGDGCQTPRVPGFHTLLGIGEEFGELCHSHLKQEQCIRGTEAEHEANAKDALADMIIYMCDYASRRGWDLEGIVVETWAAVSQRDWKANPADGSTGRGGTDR